MVLKAILVNHRPECATALRSRLQSGAIRFQVNAGNIAETAKIVPHLPIRTDRFAVRRVHKGIDFYTAIRKAFMERFAALEAQRDWRFSTDFADKE